MKTADSPAHPFPAIFRAALVYLAIVFAAGFVLGTIRVLVLVPQLGKQAAELLELPVMLLVSFFAARFIVFRFSRGRVSFYGFAGCLALAMLVALELGLVLGLQGVTVHEYVASRDPVAGSAYLLSLLAYGAMPLLVAVRTRRFDGKNTGADSA